ncbi:aminoglycoside phosphotransferase family protein [Legionella sp. CNM-4043-24]|uniref:aminoglycoside phosphotransferase family protein n=1 Tax=Legionella sp. CNM-4043-24 TaxID=3421646 RepID=UPI00403A93F4
MPNRQNALHNWLNQALHSVPFSLTALAGDASFRHYHRLHYDNVSRIIMDAPPDKESTESFISVARLLSQHGVKAPQLYAMDTAQGFIMLDDFGDQVFLKALSASNANALYQAAMDALITLQQIPVSSETPLPEFDRRHCLSELAVFDHWFLEAYLGLKLSASEKRMIQDSCDWLSDAVLKQPRVMIHRDYHSRNLMVLNQNPPFELGIIDFQDAMMGPFTYDLVSLLKDCYVQWPTEQITQWVSYFYSHSTVARQYSLPDFIRAFDLCGLQRHLKVLGVFSRLYLRDGKAGYLNDLPLTLHYVMSCLETCKELQALYQFMQDRVKL